jgi:4-amino-4-deoxy-L-arabinose transferase-like glycosyltransferase
LLLRLAIPAVRGIEDHHAGGYDFYVEMADHLRAGEGLYRTLPYGHGDRFAIRTPVYPLVLAALRSLGGLFPWSVALLGALCGAAVIGVVGLTADRLFGRRAALAAATVLALWPHAVMHDSALQDTALYTALFALAMASCLRLADEDSTERMRTSFVLGLAGVLAVLTRVALLPSVLMLCVWPLVTATRAGRGRALSLAAVSVFVVVAGLAPWLARNARVLGAPVMTSDTGRSLWLGNNPQTFSVYPERSIDRAEERAWAAIPEATRAEARALASRELESDAWFRARALDWMRANPGEAFTGGLRKAWASYSPRFNPAGSAAKQIVHALAWTPAALLAILGIWRHRRRRRVLAPIGFSVLLLAMQSAVFFGHSAYRLYLDPWVILLAASLLAGKDASRS